MTRILLPIVWIAWGVAYPLMSWSLQADDLFTTRLIILPLSGVILLAAGIVRAGRLVHVATVGLADIEADAGAGMGAFEALNGQPTPAALALAIKDAAARHHGSVGVAWLRLVVARRPELADLITEAGRDPEVGALVLRAEGNSSGNDAGSSATLVINRGIPAGRIDTISFGKERPIAEGSNEDAFARNRNAHTAIVSGAPR